MSSPSAEEFVERLQAKDPTLWGPAGTPELADRLGWIDLTETMVPRIAELEAVGTSAVADGTDDVVLLGMGGSSLAPQVFASVLGIRPGYPRFTVLDSTHPDQVAGLAEAIDARRTMFIVSSKSGGTLETLSAFRFFWRAAAGDGSRFVAITDPGTPLENLARERGFRAAVTAPPDVGGRFSALSPFGLVPAAMMGADLSALLEAASAVSWDESVELGIRWGESALSGQDKLTVLTSPELTVFPDWIEQLIAESLGKDGKGIVPIVNEPGLDRYGDDRLFLGYRLGYEPSATPPLGYSTIERTLPERYRLAAEILTAEIATAVAGALLAVHPFNQPDVELAKQRARQALESEPGRVDLIDFFSPALADLIGDWQAGIRPGDYAAVHAYLPYQPEVAAALREIRYRIGNRAGNATTSGYGPRFLHSTGQLHKGGPDTAAFLQLVDTPNHEVPIPETGLDFGRVIASQALGDYLALRDRGRRILRIDLGPKRQKGLDALIEAIG
ncbi:MAG: hypothetical protein ACRDWH_06930 [Acidimicrobiia bacterium]